MHCSFLRLCIANQEVLLNSVKSSRCINEDVVQESLLSRELQLQKPQCVCADHLLSFLFPLLQGNNRILQPNKCDKSCMSSVYTMHKIDYTATPATH
jgi:hypothetical protein